MKIKSFILFITILSANVSCNKDMVQDGVDSSQDPRVPDINVKLIADSIQSGGSTGDITGVRAGSSKDIVFTIENRGTEDLVLTGFPIVLISGDNAEEFPQDQIIQPLTVIAGGTSEPFTVVFAPSDANPKSALITIESNDPDEPVYVFTINGHPNPQAKFITRYRRGQSPLTVQFTDQSGGQVASREWDFNYDGIVDSTEASPTYTYTSLGTYTVSLKVTGKYYDDYLVRTDYVSVELPKKNIINKTSNTSGYVYSFDLDNDGKNDILTYNDNDILWFRNEGSGEFGISQTIGKDFYAECIYASDIDIDNNNGIDIVAVDISGNVTWFQNNSSGSFAPPSNIGSVSTLATQIYCADINSDGNNDVLVSRGTNIYNWRSNGNGTFTPGTTISLSTTTGITDFKLANIDNDSYLDIVVVGELKFVSEYIVWLKNDGIGNFSTGGNIGGTEGAISVFLIDIDVDSNSLIDVVTASSARNEIAWWKHNSNGTWTKNIIDNNFTGAGSVFTDDFDNDGDVDIAASALNGNDIAWWQNNGSEVFAKHTIDNIFNRPVHIYAENVDDDANLEIISASSADNEIAYWNVTGEDFWFTNIIKEDIDGANSVYLADFNNDGSIDVAGSSNNIVAWWANMNGVGSVWSEKIIDSDLQNVRLTYAIDMDKDNDIDILGTNLTGIHCWENNGNGTSFELHSITGGLLSVIDVKSAYITNDQIIDLLTTQYSVYSLSLWQGSGNFIFEDDAAINSDRAWISLYTGDLNKDTYIDILSCAMGITNTGRISWFTNNGSGGFIEKNIITNCNPEQVLGVDLDSDNDPDVIAIASVNNGTGTFVPGIYSWENLDSLGSFGTSRLIVPGSFNCFQSVDIDNDGDMEIIAGTKGTTGRVIWIENTDGLGTAWKSHLIADNLNVVSSIAAADIDGDEDMDVAGAIQGDNVIVWWENNLAKWGK